MVSTIDWTLPRQRCPACGREREHGARGTLGVTVKADGSAIAHCFRCDYVETYRPDSQTRFMKAAARPVPPRAQPQRHETLSQHGMAMFADCEPLAGTVGAAYLRARQCVLPPADGDLRFHRGLRHPPSGYVGPALVALVTDAVTREPLTLHRTWIKPDGTKAHEADPPRMLLGGHRKAGGVVRLWADADVSTGMAVGGGVESALAVAHAYTPVWALIDAGNMAAFPVLPGIESLLIAADHDPAGIRAAHACADRWASAGREVHIVMAPAAGQDINDVARCAA